MPPPDAAAGISAPGEGLSEIPSLDTPSESLPEWPRAMRRDIRAPIPAIDETDLSNGPSAALQAAAQNDRYASPQYGNPQAAPPDDETPAQRRLREMLVRPFKRMHEINPYFDYEPDPETAKQDRCFNLCPRPGSPDCPDCEPFDANRAADAGRLVCPECPAELDLRDSSRYTGQSLEYPVRNFAHINYCWEPTNLYNLPLYFQDACLERYGHTRHYTIQPLFSVGLFATQLVGLPYQMSIDPVWKKRYALGWYRPGQCVPYKYYQIPWNTQAALTEAGVITGAYFLFAPAVSP